MGGGSSNANTFVLDSGKKQIDLEVVGQHKFNLNHLLNVMVACTSFTVFNSFLFNYKTNFNRCFLCYEWYSVFKTI